MNGDLLPGLTVGSARLWGLEAGFTLSACTLEQPMAWFAGYTARTACHRRLKRTRGRPRLVYRDSPYRRTTGPYEKNALSVKRDIHLVRR